MSKLRWECSSFLLPISFRLSPVRPGEQANTQTLLHDQKNPTHHISGACSPHSPLYRFATHMFPLLTIRAWCVRLWREAIWGGQGRVTSARRAWPDTGDFSSHGRPRCCFYHAAQDGTYSWITQEKFSALPAEALPPFPKLAVMITTSEASWTSTEPKRENNCLVLLLPSLPPVVCGASLYLSLPVLQSKATYLGDQKVSRQNKPQAQPWQR